MTIKIITDNCCDLPQEIIERYDIGLIDMLVRFGDYECRPEELSNRRSFYKLMEQSIILPKTTQPSLIKIMDTYQQALDDGSDVIAIHLSSGITGTVKTAQMIAKIINNPRLHIVDSKKASIGLGLLVVHAARMAKNGSSINDILGRLQELQNTMQCMFFVSNPEHLVKGGRISRVKGLTAEILNIKPILHFNEDGYIMLLDKARGNKAALNKLLYIMENTGYNLSNQIVGVNHSDCASFGNYLSESIIERFGVKEVILGEIGPVIGSHVGPGTASVFFERKYQK